MGQYILKIPFIILVLTTLMGCVVGDIQAPKDSSGATIAPSVTAVTPTAGPLLGGTTITLTGSAFSTGMTIAIGATSCSSVSVLSSTAASCVTPASTAGTKSITVTSSDGKSGSLSNAFTYQPAPTVSGISPALGSTAGGTTVTVSGTNFVSGATVTVGGVNCSSVNVVSSTSLTCVTGARAAAAVSAIVTNTDGQVSAAGGSYTYTAPPAITSTNVNAGAISGGTTFQVIGANFDATAQVTVAGVACTGEVVTGTTQIDCTTGSSGSAVTGDVIVINTGNITATLTNGYTYQPAPTVTGITPSGGSPSGGTTVTISGTGFDTVNGITADIGGNNCGSISSLTSTSFNCVTTAGTGTQAVNVVNLDGDNQTGTLASAFTYQNAPTISSVNAPFGTSAAGALAGGTSLTITGTGFLTGVAVTVGGSTCTITASTLPTSLTCTTPSGSSGATNVTVTNTDSQSATSTGAFTYQAAPTISSISPVGGPRAGGNSVTINGSGFDTTNGLNSVTIAGSACTSVTGLSATSFSCTVPGTFSGAQDVYVQNNDGDRQDTTASGAYFYANAPTVSSITPNAGKLAGGDTVSISGSGFQTNATVTIGGNTCTSPSVVSPTTMTCVVPSGTAGTANVVVTNPDTQNGTGLNLYTYRVPPTVTGVTPDAGILAGGNTITISGTGFVTGASVTLGGVTCDSPSVLSSSSLTCVPRSVSSAQSVDVVVTNSPDNQSATLSNGYTYQNPPTITSITPNGGDPAGGTTVTITGTGFDTSNGISSVDIGGVNCGTVNPVNSTTLSCITGANTAGIYNVRVTNNDGGTQSGVLTNGYTYQPGPTISSVSPTGGPQSGGTAITITGTDFLSGATVTVGGNTCNNIVFVNSTEITCDTPAGTSGAKDVVVSNPDNQFDNVTGSFTYDDPPTVTGVTPNTGALAGGTSITISGSAFNPGPPTVTIGGVTCASATYVSTSSLTCVTGANTAGLKDIVVTNSDNQSGTGSGLFRYQPAPTVSSASPSTGSTAGGETVTITGSDFDTTNGILNVQLNGALCTSINLIDNTQLTCITASSTAGVGNVVVTNADGDSQFGTLTNGFTYVDPPSITSLSVTNGPSSGGQALTINGANFNQASPLTIKIGSATCTVVTVAADGSSVDCTTGSSVPGTFNVTVTGFDGQSDTFSSYTYDPAPTVSTVFNNATGGTAGSTLMTLGGSNFVATPTVTVGGSACTPVSFVNSGQINCSTPAGVLGGADVVVTNPDGQSTTVTDGFTYVATPTVSSASPSVISTTTSTSIIINGSGFIDENPVTVTIDPGGTNDICTSPSVNTAGTQITCTAPAHTAGQVSVQVTNGDGDAQVGTGTNILNYVAPPTISGVLPNKGPVNATTAIQITGTNFVSSPTPVVTVDGQLCTSVTVPSTTQIDCTAPAGSSTGAKDVVVTLYSSLTVTSTGGFTYDPPPTVTSVDIPQGPKTGGTSITISGSNFQGVANGYPTDPTITVGGLSCTPVTFNSATSLTCDTTGTGPTGSASNIIVTNQDGQSGTGTGLFTYLEPPSVTSISPNNGKESGGETVTISGSNFISGATVTIGGASCTGVSVASSSSLTCTTPALTIGAHNVVVTNPDGQFSTLVSAWTSEGEPTFTGISPSSGTLTGGTTVTIDGTKFESGAVVYFGANPVSLDSFSATQIIVTSPSAASTGFVDIVVQNPTGQSVTSTNAFEYTPAAPELDWQLGVASPTPPNPDIYGPTASNESHTYTLENVGSVTTGSITISIGGTDPGAFFLSSPGSGDNCTGTTLAPGGTCQVQVVFLGSLLTSGASVTATLNATDGTTSDSNTMNGSVP